MTSPCHPRRAGWPVLVLLALVLLALPQPSFGQTATGDAAAAAQQQAMGAAAPLDAAAIDEMLAVMPDGEVRRALRDRLLADLQSRRAATTAPTPPAAASQLAFYEDRLGWAAGGLARLPGAIAQALQRPLGQDAPIPLWRLAAYLLGFIAVGFVAMAVVRRLTAPRRARLAATPSQSPLGRFGTAAFRLSLELLEVAAFLAAVAIVYLLLSPGHPAAPVILERFLVTAAVILVTWQVACFFCSPREPGMRLVAIDDVAASGIVRVVVTTVAITAILSAVIQTLVKLGMPADSVAALSLILSPLPFLYLIVVFLRFKSTITEQAIEQLKLARAARPFVTLVPGLSIVYLVVVWLVLADGILRQHPDLAPRALISLLIVLAAPLLALLVRAPLEQAYGLTGAAEQDGEALHHVDRLMRLVWIILAVLVVVGTAVVWGVDPTAVGVEATATRILFNVGAVLLLAYIVWVLIQRWIERRIAATAEDPDRTRAQRLRTLLPLFRTFLKTVLLVLVVMIVLSSLGVEIGPLLAGAGVVGLAIGLGSQQTIADIVAGVFFLLEDAFRVGDYVEVGNIRGTVESISLRSLKLRHQRGAVHTLPFGQIKAMTNYTRDWALIRLEFRVPPDTDLALVKRIIKDIGKELSADPALGPGFIDPLKSQGVRRVEDHAIVIGVKYIAKPGTQFTIRREAFAKILAAFQEHGIELVGRGVVVKVEDADHGRGSETAAAAAAAAAIGQGAEH
jgi:small-conductance mechanosensitive channel